MLFTDWRGDADERLLGKEGSDVLQMLGEADQLHPPRLGPLARLWARPMARFVHDPDGRPAGLRRARRF